MGKYRSLKKKGSAGKASEKPSSFNILRKHNKGARTPRKSKTSKEVPLQSQQWKLKVNPEDWFQGKINVKPSDLITETLKRRFTDEQERMFRLTCFGCFLDMQEIAVNPQLIHQVLLREINQPNEEEIWFAIGNDNVKFGIDDFYLVTGLRYSGDDNQGNHISKYCRLRAEYFSHLPHITNDDVFQVFNSMSDRNTRDVVIIGILFLLTQLMMNTAYERCVDEKLLVLVDSIEMKFYPWGKDIFKRTLSSLKSALRNKQTTVEGVGRPTMSYRLNGFVIAFQVSIYKILPILESNICLKVASRRPRILNWTSEVKNDAPLLNLATDIFLHPDLRVKKLVPQVAEALDPLYVSMKHATDPKPGKSKKVAPKTILIDDDDDFTIPLVSHPKQHHQITSHHIAHTQSTEKFKAAPVVDEDKIPPVPKFADHEICIDVEKDYLPRNFTAPLVIRDHQEHVNFIPECNSHKGKEIVYEVDSSDDEQGCLVDDYSGPFYNRFQGESSHSSNAHSSDLIFSCTTVPVCPSVNLSNVESPAARCVTIASAHSQDTNCDERAKSSSLPETHCTQGAGQITAIAATHSRGPNRDDQAKSDTAPQTHYPQDVKRITNKYIAKLDIIVREHAKLAEENFILKMKVQGLQTYFNAQIAEVLDGIKMMSIINPSNECRTPFMNKSFSGNTKTKVCHSGVVQGYNNHVNKFTSNQNSSTKQISLQGSQNNGSRISDGNVIGQNFIQAKKGGSNLQHNQPHIAVPRTSIDMLPGEFCTPDVSKVKSSSNDSSRNGKISTQPIENSTSIKKASVGSCSSHYNDTNNQNFDTNCPSTSPAPSFDLGPEFHIDDESVILEDGLVLTNEHFKEMDAIVVEVLSSKGKLQKPKWDETCSTKRKSDVQQHQHSGLSPVGSHFTSYTKTDAGTGSCSRNTPFKKLRASHGIVKQISPVRINFSEAASPNCGSMNKQNKSVHYKGCEVKSIQGSDYIFSYKTCMDPPSDTDIQKFTIFYCDCIKANNGKVAFNNDVAEIRRGTKLGPITVDSDMWWHDLCEVARPLNDTHLDAVFYFIRMLLRLNNGSKLRATTTDCNFDVKIRGISKDLINNNQAIHKHDSLFSYTLGRKIQFNIPWTQVDHVLIPMWIQSPGHWILAHFDMVNWRIDVYNSYTRIIKNALVWSSIRPMLIVIPILARSLNSSVRTFPDGPLDCRIIESCAQQQNGGDCGIYVIKYAEFLIEGKINEMSSMYDTATGRSHIATQLYKYMLEGPDIIWINSSKSITLRS